MSYPGKSGASSVDVWYWFTGLHLDKERNVKIDNAHFKLHLNGDGDVEGQVECGVNIQVEDRRPRGSRRK